MLCNLLDFLQAIASFLVALLDNFCETGPKGRHPAVLPSPFRQPQYLKQRQMIHSPTQQLD